MMKNKKTSFKKSKGFTLVEVIVAVSIVVILASFAVPKITGYIEKTKSVKLTNTCKQMQTAVMWSYVEQSNTIDNAKITDTINKTLSGITLTNVTNADNKVTITFSSDGSSHTLIVDITANTYAVS